MENRNWVSLIFLVAFVVGHAAAQEAEKKVVKEMPPGWKLRLDRAEAKKEDFQFWAMPPGWHMTTGPAGIVYDPAQTAAGEFRIESESFLFQPEGEMREGYGIFFGGSQLDSEDQTYIYFLVRRDGQFLVKQRKGKATSSLIPWTANPAILKHDGSNRTTKNVLAVEVMKDMVSFQVNGREVATLPRKDLVTDGQVGLRINHHLNLHVTNLNVIPRGAMR